MIQRLWHKLTRALLLRRLARIPGVELGPAVTLYGYPNVSVKPGSTLRLGQAVVLCSQTEFTALGLNHPIKMATLRAGALIEIGASTGISGGSFIAAQRITIGSEVLIGANVTIVDTDFHPVAATNRRHSDDESRIGVAPVEIGNNVFIGANSIILKGTVIGADCVVGAGSVVRGVFPSKVILAGNPAKIVGHVPD